MLTTKTKVWLAGVAYKFIAVARSAAGKDSHVNVRRQGLRWNLDLREGIDFSIYLLGAFEPGTQKTLSKLIKPGDIVFDIGANIGAHTLGMARSVGPSGKVYAFEPADFAFAKLRQNFSLNPELESRLHAHQVFLGAPIAESTPMQVYASWPLRHDRTVHPKHRGRLVSAAQASADTLDSFVERYKIDRVDLIKMDVDGCELPVLQGGLQTIQRFHPILVMEMSPYVHAEHNYNFGDFITLLRNSGYSVRDADTWQPVPLDAAQLERIIPDGASINVVAQAGAVPAWP
jgi:FkbM family methyltransferase